MTDKHSSDSAVPTRGPQPIILIRGFGGLGVEDEKKIAYQGFNDGTVYPQKRGENYIYEGLILRFMKSRWRYQDATNVVGYYGARSRDGRVPAVAEQLSDLEPKFFSGSKVVIDPGMAAQSSAGEERSAPDALGLPLLRPQRSQLPDLRRDAGPLDRLHPRARRVQAKFDPSYRSRPGRR